MPPRKNNRQFRKPARGGGHKFTNPRHLAAAKNTEEEGMWGYRDKNEEEVSSSEEESDEQKEKSNKGSSSKDNKNSQESDNDVSDEEDDDDDNHRSKSSSVIDVENPNRTKKDNLKASDIADSPREMTRKEREAAEKEAARQRYWKLHVEGKTEQAKADLERLAVIKKQREEAALKRKEEQEAKAEAQKAKLASQGRKVKK